MARPAILLQNHHTEIVAGEVRQCCIWKLSEVIGTVETGEVAYVPSQSELRCDVVEALKRLSVAAINGLQSDYVFDDSDCVVWEIG